MAGMSGSRGGTCKQSEAGMDRGAMLNWWVWLHS